jgi:glycosyltransferase involved in cell wall biosynthesis
MRIGLNAISFHPGRMGGMETYFRNLLGQLQGIDRENSYDLFCAERFVGEFQLFNDGFRIRRLNYARPSFNWLLRGLLRNTLNHDILVGKMRRLELDVIHHPFNVLTPPGLKIPSVLTFWDMQHEFFPEFFNSVELRKRRRIYRASAEAATRIIVAAAFTKECLIQKYGIKADNIEVIHTGYGPEYGIIEDEDLFARLRRKYGLTRPFLFYPAATWPHKNHKALLAALKIMREQFSFDGVLVLTGIAMQAHNAICEEIDRLGLGEVVKVLGYVPADELPGLYNLARILVFPSLFEGFGIPLVEAMACGCPVACADATSLPEVIGDAGELFDPCSPEEMADKLWSLWNDEARLGLMRRRGVERANLFNWEQTARKTMDVYKKAAGAP